MFCGEVGGYDAQQDTKDVKGEQLDVEFGNMYTREIESFGNSILNNLPLEVPASDAVQVQRVMEAAYRSNDNKCVVDLYFKENSTIMLPAPPAAREDKKKLIP